MAIAAAFARLEAAMGSWQTEMGGSALDLVWSQYSQGSKGWLERYARWPVSLREEDTTAALNQSLEELEQLDERMREILNEQLEMEADTRPEHDAVAAKLHGLDDEIREAERQLHQALQGCLAE
jgi:hypothetical protein